MPKSLFNRHPYVTVKGGHPSWTGWDQIAGRLAEDAVSSRNALKVICIDFYPGVYEEEITRQLTDRILPDAVIAMSDLMLAEDRIRELVHPYVTDDRLFGYLSPLLLEDFFDAEKVESARRFLGSDFEGTVLVTGTGSALLLPEDGLLVYADMARWEIQLRMRKGQVNSLGLKNKDIPDWMLLYKQGYFVDWRVCDRWKSDLTARWDYLLDTNDSAVPKLVTGKAVLEGLQECLTRPFSVVPFFDPGPWGGQWMKEHCNLDPEPENYAWCFNCVPEENSLLLRFGETTVEIPSVNLVFQAPEQLLGKAVYERFGAEFPIRFDFLDTVGGGNLSLQVHPLTAYIRDRFGMDYTQDESYYLMEALPGAQVFLGLKEGICPDEMIGALEKAQDGGEPFDAERFVQTWPVKKHDHVLIPGGTVHCSGRDCMVLEISATPYIFTFKLWDWGRLGMDGRPRPINIGHGRNNIQWNRTTEWTRRNLVNRVEKVAEGSGWTEERTGLHELEFIETRRHWFSVPVQHNTGGGVNVLCLVEGDEVTVESPEQAFLPFTVHYAETFIVPAAVGPYTVRPSGESSGKRCATVKAYVRG